MRNGGGPACLRLRVMLSEVEQSKMHQGIIMTRILYQKLDAWVDKYYRDRFSAQDFLDPNLITEVNTALDKLTQILQLGPIYPFQMYDRYVKDIYYSDALK